jgi:DNA adenine methylase
VDYTKPTKGIRYSGAKGKCREIVKIINSYTRGTLKYWEPFVGSGKIIQSVRAGFRYGSDIDRPIINLLLAVQSGWNPPETVTEKQYKLWMSRRNDPAYENSPMLGFIGYGCSFGARYYQGFARSKRGTVNFAASARAALLRQKPYLENKVVLWISDYRQAFLSGRFPDVVYCDCPYNDTKPAGSKMERFDSAEFWEYAAEWSKRAVVLCSEYQCPIKSAKVVWAKSVPAGIRFGTNGNGGDRGSGKMKEERLFLLTAGADKRVGLGIL